MFDTRHNPDNEIIKYKFFERLENSKDGRDPETVNQFVNAVHEFEIATGFKDFRKYTSDWAIIFKDCLNDKTNQRTGKNISASLYLHYISHVRQFLKWIFDNEKEYKLKQDDIDYMHVTRKEKTKARATNHPESHDIADILATIRKMPETTDIEIRNKAIMSLFLLTTPRISSLQEARLGRIKYFKDYDCWVFLQDPRFQNTKGSKYITSFFIGEVEDIIQNVIKWCDLLVAKGYKDSDYLFPKITPSFTKDGNSIMILTKDYIQSDTKIRDIVKAAYENNGLKYIKPHNFRHSVARHVRKANINTTDTLIALAENAGQKNGFSTLVTSYAGDPLERRARMMKVILLE
jgi:integrase